MKRLLLSGFALALSTTSCSNKPTPAPHASTVQGVRTEVVQASLVDEYYEAVGTVRAKNTTIVAARIMGNIVSLPVREGDRVRAGQTVGEIENRGAGIQITKSLAGVREAQNALAEGSDNIQGTASAVSAARATESLARLTYNRYRTLFERRSVSPQEFDEVRTKLDIAKAETDRAERMLQAARARQNQALARFDQAQADLANARVYAGYARLVSAISGVVVAKHSDVGSMAVPGAPLLTIENDSQYRLDVSVEESLLGKIHVNDQAKVHIEALGNQELTCSVEEIVPTVDSNSRSYTVKLRLPNPDGGVLRSGLFGRAQFVAGQRRVLTVPQKSLTQSGQLVSVFVVDSSGTARLRLIKTGEKTADRVEVLSGLNDGEQIVIEASPQIKDGTRVRDAQVAAKQ